jgi:hypothetical protein
MPWSNSRPGTDPKYRTKAHRDERAKWVREIKRTGSAQCAQPECVMDSRTIYDGQPWHLGHDDTGTRYIGPVHPACNVRDGARRGNARSRGGSIARRWPL